MNTMLAGEAHGTQAAAVKGVEQVLALGWQVAETTITAGADDGGLRGKVGRHRLHTGVCMQLMPRKG